MEIEEINSKIQNIELPKFSPIQIEFFEKKNNKTTQLIDNQKVNKFIRGKHKWYDFLLCEEVYVEQIRIDTEKYSSLDSCDFRFIDDAGNTVELRPERNSKDAFEFRPKSIITRFSFKPTAKYLTTPLIKSVKVEGYNPMELKAVTKIISDLENSKQEFLAECSQKKLELDKKSAELIEFDTQKADLTSEVKNLNSNIAELQSEITSLNSEKSSLNAENSALKGQENEIKTRIEAIEDSIDQKKKEQTALNDLKAENEQILRKLESDINMFPSELSSYEERADKNVKFYGLISAVPIIVLVIITAALFINAANLTDFYKDGNIKSILEVLLTRLPYVIICVAILGAIFKALSLLFFEVIEINRKRQELFKVSILATDISDAASHDLGFNNENLYQKRVALKMEMIKEHLKQNISHDYKYVLNDKINDTNRSKPQLKKQISEEIAD